MGESMNPRGLVRDQRGGAAIEMLLLFPFIILLNCFLIQLAHLFVCHQVMQYAAFGAARAALAADVDPQSAPPATNWVGKAGDPEFNRAVRAAWQVCSLLEMVGPQENVEWRKLPIRWKKEGYDDISTPPKYRYSPNDRAKTFLRKVSVNLQGGADRDEVRVGILYDTYLPVPFANRIVFNAFQNAGRASATDLRVELAQFCTLVRPWN
ncbi:MAG: pilus assembly protein [Planctomycetota bacterium]|nr:pilus assembly protein [Planctomycetota bacterium]